MGKSVKKKKSVIRLVVNWEKECMKGNFLRSEIKSVHKLQKRPVILLTIKDQLASKTSLPSEWKQYTHCGKWKYLSRETVDQVLLQEYETSW